MSDTEITLDTIPDKTVKIYTGKFKLYFNVPCRGRYEFSNIYKIIDDELNNGIQLIIDTYDDVSLHTTRTNLNFTEEEKDEQEQEEERLNITRYRHLSRIGSRIGSSINTVVPITIDDCPNN